MWHTPPVYADDWQLTLRTVNSNRSAFAYFVFQPKFFSKYEVGTGAAREGEDNLRFKTLNKSCQAAFKSLVALEKTVERCSIHVDLDDCRLVIRMHCKHAIIKTHRLHFEECETLQAVYDKSMAPNVIVGPPRLLSETLANFQPGQEEVSFQASPSAFLVTNATDLETDRR